jgi:adenylylsulfate kinase-like enzyme
VRVSSDNQAYALLDSVDPLTADVMWVSGISGSLEGKETILRELIQEAKRQYQRLIVDGSDEPDIQTVFDAMGFEPPDEDGTFIIVEKWL